MPPQAPLVIAGDFNDWRELASRILVERLKLSKLSNHGGEGGAKLSHRALPLFRLDRIYVRGFHVEEAQVHQGRPWSKISDHAVLHGKDGPPMIVAEACSGQDQIIAAAALLRDGGVVAFPTETVYGLGAEISQACPQCGACSISKSGLLGHPLIVHFADVSGLEHWAREVPTQALRLAERFWPGPLTLILRRSGHVPQM